MAENTSPTAGGSSSLLGLFAPPPPPPAAATDDSDDDAQDGSISAQDAVAIEELAAATAARSANENLRDTFASSNTSLHSSSRNNFGDDNDNSNNNNDQRGVVQEPDFERLFRVEPPRGGGGGEGGNGHCLKSSALTDEQTPLLSSSSLQHHHQKSPSYGFDAATPKAGLRKSAVMGDGGGAHHAPQMQQPPLRHQRPSLANTQQLPSIREMTATIPTTGGAGGNAAPDNNRNNTNTTFATTITTALRTVLTEASKPTTWIGSLMYTLFHVVFCLTMGAAITRPYATTSLLGVMTKTAALGTMFGVVPYWLNLSRDIPSLYPTVDLFCAPFLANIAVQVDTALHQDHSITTAAENDECFLASFSLLTVMAWVISGTLLVMASYFKLANLGSYLPFPVLCGFFASVGVLTWTLAFKVDNNGVGVGAVLSSGDSAIIQHAVIHHVPSMLVAAIMKYLGPKNPTFVVAVSLGTIALFYIYMFFFGISMDEMIQEEWFWSTSDLIYQRQSSVIGFQIWAPPAPFGWINSLLGGKVKWGAVQEGLDTTIALSFLYLIRCSLHGAALKKNVSNLQRAAKEETATAATTMTAAAGTRGQHQRGASFGFSLPRPAHERKFSEAIDIEHIMGTVGGGDNGSAAPVIERAKATNIPLSNILFQYGFSQFWCALAGGFAVTPSVAASSTMYVLRAEHVAPQVGSVILLFVFYMTNFELVGYIPKPAFSSLLVLAFYDMIWTWFVKSYFKTKEKMEWLVVPAIVVFAFVIGLLQAVFLGLAMSTFLFVAAFFRSGVVKFLSNGQTIRSTIQRPIRDARWLDQNGDLIQILILQNYLFFGNASSIESYISSMFDDPEEEVDPLFLPPLPKIIILDLTLVTGSDTSAVDAFSDILVLCGNYGCKLFLAGVSPSLRQVMYLCGVKPESNKNRKQRKLRFFPNLDSAVGKAEDMLLDNENTLSPIHIVRDESGFQSALRSIDEQHETTALQDLAGLEDYVQVIELSPDETLYEDHLCDRGIFFIEQGVLKTERKTDLTAAPLGGDAFSRLANNGGTLRGIAARTGSIGRVTAELKATQAAALTSNFRVARVGPGFIIGKIECLAEATRGAFTVAVTPCRLHHLSFNKIKEAEESQPLLVLTLYKLLARLMAKQQELTIGQLGTLHAIMGASAQKKPSKRVSNHGLRQATSTMSLG